MTLTSEEKEFIKGHAYLFDESREVDFFVAALEQFPNGPNFRHIVNYIQDVCNMDTTEYLLKLFTIELLKNIDYYKNSHVTKIHPTAGQDYNGKYLELETLD